MEPRFPPAERKQAADGLVGPHSLKTLIGHCVIQEEGRKDGFTDQGILYLVILRVMDWRAVQHVQKSPVLPSRRGCYTSLLFFPNKSTFVHHCESIMMLSHVFIILCSF